MKWWAWIPWSSFFECWVLSQFFHSLLSPSLRGSLSPLCFSAIREVSSAHLRLLIFLPAILLPACDSSSPAFHMMYFAYKWQYTAFSVYVQLKPSLKDFEPYLANTWDECNCMVVRTFFGVTLLWVWSENWTFPVPWPLLSFPNLLIYWVQHFNIIIF